MEIKGPLSHRILPHQNEENSKTKSESKNDKYDLDIQVKNSSTDQEASPVKHNSQIGCTMGVVCMRTRGSCGGKCQ